MLDIRSIECPPKQRDLTNAQSRLALALVGLRLAWQNLDAATGKILLPFTP
jgi:hypothetical protein